MHWIEQLREIARDGGEDWHLIAADLCEENGATLLSIRIRSGYSVNSIWQWVFENIDWFRFYCDTKDDVYQEWNRIAGEYKGEPKTGDVVRGPF